MLRLRRKRNRLIQRDQPIRREGRREKGERRDEQALGSRAVCQVVKKNLLSKGMIARLGKDEAWQS